MIDVGQKESIKIARVELRGRVVELKKPITLNIERKAEDYYSATTDPEFGSGHIWINADSQTGLIRELGDELAFLVDHYGNVADDQLTAGARKLKTLVNEYI